MRVDRTLQNRPQTQSNQQNLAPLVLFPLLKEWARVMVLLLPLVATGRGWGNTVFLGSGMPSRTTNPL